MPAIDNLLENIMKYLHTMVRIADLDQSLAFYRDALGLDVVHKMDVPAGRYTLIYLAAPGDSAAQVELTHNWDEHAYSGGRNFGHLAYSVPDIYAATQRLLDHGVTVSRPPRDGEAPGTEPPHQYVPLRCRRRLQPPPRRRLARLRPQRRPPAHGDPGRPAPASAPATEEACRPR
jgi:lactoylglutathione lyase